MVPPRHRGPRSAPAPDSLVTLVLKKFERLNIVVRVNDLVSTCMKQNYENIYMYIYLFQFVMHITVRCTYLGLKVSNCHIQ